MVEHYKSSPKTVAKVNNLMILTFYSLVQRLKEEMAFISDDNSVYLLYI